MDAPGGNGVHARRLAWLSAIALATTGLATGVDVAVPAQPASAASYVGSAARLTLKQPIVDMAATPSGNGYWLVAADGGFFSFGDAHFYGSTGALRLKQPVVGMTATATGRGYWLVASDGGIFTFGDARFYGSAGALRLKQPVVGMAATPTGRGYWLVASDGGIFTLGDARFYGSTGALRLRRPIVGMAPTSTGHGYWLVASDGGIFTFGDARFYGSTGATRLLVPIVGMAEVRSGGGYWLVARDGSVYPYGNARFFGSAAGAMAGQPTIGMVSSPRNDGYWIASQWGAIATASVGGVKADPNLVPRTGEGAIANELVTRIDAERTRRGLVPLITDRTLQYDAIVWAHALNARDQLVHQNLEAILGQAFGGWAEVGENPFMGGGAGATDAGTAHLALMSSDGHRANILLPEERLVGVGAACAYGRLVVVEDFATPAGIALRPHPVPPLTPIAAPNDGGASC